MILVSFTAIRLDFVIQGLDVILSGLLEIDISVFYSPFFLSNIIHYMMYIASQHKAFLHLLYFY